MSVSAKENISTMSALGNNAYKDGNKATFWKKNAKSVPGSIKPVYGAQHPPIQEMPATSQHGTPKKDVKLKQRDSFQDFQKNTIDAWDDGDDDVMMMVQNKISMKEADEIAMQVIQSHSQQVLAAARDRVSGSSPPRDRMGSNDSDTHPAAPGSSPGTPSHTPSHKPSGPGVGVRLHTHFHVGSVSPLMAGQLPVPDRESSKMDKFKSLLQVPSLDLNELRSISWSGIPRQYRPTTWKILSGYLPPSLDRRELTLRRKRQEYFNFVDQYFDTRHQELNSETFRQIHIDIPRMSPLIPLFHQKVVQELFERLLFIWAIRHPASGYVQGINDLVTPFFVVFLSEYISEGADLDSYDVGSLPESDQRMLEADSFWCFSKLLDGIQENYTFAQPGIQKKILALKDLVNRIDKSLHDHLESQNVEYLQFSFRWMNNLLMREMPLHCVIRLWDTYLAEHEGFAMFHVYVCAAFLTKFSSDLLRERDFQGLMIMLQNLPTHNWSNEEIGLMLAKAYELKYLYADAPNHLSQKR